MAEEQSLRKVDGLFFLLFYSFFVVAYENQHSKFRLAEHAEKYRQFWNRQLAAANWGDLSL